MSNTDSATYLPGEGLAAVLDLALDLGLPLLVTGEPGTGKTQLAYHVARKLKLEKPYIFNTKTDSQARDLFYSYDAIRHFRDSGRDQGGQQALDYISFNALGQALIESGSKRAVVLIDEIDKAPRDFPNDLLYEFEHLAFQVKEATAAETQAELGEQIPVDEQGFIRLAEPQNRPVLILTSNSEKNLPDAFMRRVLYHHIEFPRRERLQEIIDANISPDSQLDQKLVQAAIDHFEDIRQNKRLRKPPATAELLAWIHVLHRQKADLATALKASADRALKQQIFNSYALIAKNKEDLATLKRDLGL
jgi:MoxR-like ATPase